jgi:CRP-like cAMP-binding protein
LIYKVGDEDNQLYLVKKGEIRLKIGNQYLVSVGEGDYFGEFEVISVQSS